ncbi:hypothetical protein [Streptomyces sp. NBC_01235]|uniref:hypothetical protein n=1 Tax=Streptomyces sp. NBC_01235 TaxID=2903788 RepID=UPI002E108002|nr:hypothetical protein OG289_22690 [Streptomyces sp. NBC_01235]
MRKIVTAMRMGGPFAAYGSFDGVVAGDVLICTGRRSGCPYRPVGIGADGRAESSKISLSKVGLDTPVTIRLEPEGAEGLANGASVPAIPERVGCLTTSGPDDHSVLYNPPEVPRVIASKTTK